MAAVYKMDSAGFYSGRIEGQARWMYCAARFADRLQALTGLTAARDADEPWHGVKVKKSRVPGVSKIRASIPQKSGVYLKFLNCFLYF